MLRADAVSLIGRDAELDLLRAALDALPEQGAALAFRGEAGIGKSSLLAAARSLAADRGARVLRTAGVVSESDVSFSGLHRLLRPLLSRAGDLEPARATALRGAFGLSESEGDDAFLVALATLDLLSAAAAEQPLLVLVDDLHWLDAPSRDAIGFVGRRVESDPVVMVLALREGYDDELGDLGMEQHMVARLADGDASRVLDAHAPGLEAAQRTRLLAEAAGNPLALVELPAALDRPGEPATRSLTDRLEQAFTARLGEMPEATTALLLIAAADESASLADVMTGASDLLGRPATVTMLQPAVEARLASASASGLQFRHPLVRSAIYQAASLDRRIAAHRALTRVFAAEPDRRAWHLAAATLGRDDAVAQEVEDMAERALRRGAILQAAQSFGRAAELSETGGPRAERLLRGAELAFHAGRADLVRAYVDEARSLDLGVLDRVRAEWLSEIFHDAGHGDGTRVLALVGFAGQAGAGGDVDLALTLLHAAALRCWWSDPGVAVRDAVVRGVEALDVDPDEARIPPIIAMVQPIARSAALIAQVSRLARSAEQDAERALQLGMAAHAVGDFEQSMRLLQHAIDLLRAQGRLGQLTHAVGMFASEATFVCEWTIAESGADEFELLARETNQPIWLHGAASAQAVVAAVKGDEERAAWLLGEAQRVVALSGGDGGSVLQNARGFCAFAAGRYEDAYTLFARMFDPRDRAHHYREKYIAVGFFADAALLTGRETETRALLSKLTVEAEADVGRALLNGLHYGRAILAADEDAEAEFAAAREAIGPRWTFDQARLNLAYGAWLRRQRRVSESREPLRAALEGLDQYDAPAWSERARQELRASGESIRGRRADNWDELSPQELKIASMAADGLSNREIGQQLYLSHRTVGSHLYRIFPKLGITSRAQLSSVLNRP